MDAKMTWNDVWAFLDRCTVREVARFEKLRQSVAIRAAVQVVLDERRELAEACGDEDNEEEDEA